MHKKFENFLSKASNDFKLYFYNDILKSDKEKLFIKTILKKDDALIFGGIVRDFLVARHKKHRTVLPNLKVNDIDIVVTTMDRFTKSFINHYYNRKNSFGGYRIIINNNHYDIWDLKKTYTFKISPHLDIDVDLKSMLPNTVFFNSMGIVYSLLDEKFIYNSKFENFLFKNELDIIVEQSYRAEINVVKAFEYKRKFDLKFSKSLTNYLIKNYKRTFEKIEPLQMKHYHRVFFKKEDYNDFLKNNLELPTYFKNKYIEKIYSRHKDII